MYGAMALKYVSGAQSLYQGISFLIYGDPEKIERVFPGVYYIAIFVFAALSIAFSFGDIENSKWLQVISSVARVVVLVFMYIGTFYYLGTDGVQRHEPVWDWKT